MKARYAEKGRNWKTDKRRKGRTKKHKKKSKSAKDDSSLSSEEDKREYVGQIMNMLMNTPAYCGMVQQQQPNQQLPLLRPNTTLQPTGVQRTPACNNCGQKGHTTRNCPLPKTICELCGTAGHLTDKCWEHEKNARFRPHNWISKLNKSCPRCGQTGHYYKHYPFKNTPLQPLQSQSTPIQNNTSLRQALGMISHSNTSNQINDFFAKRHQAYKSTKSSNTEQEDILSQVSSISIRSETLSDVSSTDESNEYCGAIYGDIEMLDELFPIIDVGDWKDAIKKEKQLIRVITTEVKPGQTNIKQDKRKRKRINKLPQSNAYSWKLP